jgi:hypothetical protein
MGEFEEVTLFLIRTEHLKLKAYSDITRQLSKGTLLVIVICISIDYSFLNPQPYIHTKHCLSAYLIPQTIVQQKCIMGTCFKGRRIRWSRITVIIRLISKKTKLKRWAYIVLESVRPSYIKVQVYSGAESTVAQHRESIIHICSVSLTAKTYGYRETNAEFLVNR